jgi:hypothetical protein
MIELDRFAAELAHVGVTGRPWTLCIGVAAPAAVLALVAGDEGARNAVVKAAAVVAGFAALGRTLGLRR